MPLVLRSHPDVCWENVPLRWLNHPFGPWLFKVDPQFSYLPFTVTIVWCLGPHFFMVLYGHHVTTQFSAKQVEVFKSAGRNGVCMYMFFNLFIYLFIYLESGGLWECVFCTDVASRSHISASDVAPRSHLYGIYICIPQNFIQLGHKNQNILHMHSEKLNSAINDSMSFSQWISERKFNFALLRHAQMIGLCLLLCCRFL